MFSSKCSLLPHWAASSATSTCLYGCKIATAREDRKKVLESSRKKAHTIVPVLSFIWGGGAGTPPTWLGVTLQLLLVKIVSAAPWPLL